MSSAEYRPGEVYWRAIEPYWESVSIYDGPSVLARDLSHVPRGVADMFSAHWCQSEVRNGGFHQFFYNSTGVLAPEAVDGFRAIGIATCSLLVVKAMDFFPKPYPRERRVRIEILDQHALELREAEDPFDRIDDRFYDVIDTENGGFDAAADRYASSLTS